MCADYHRTKDQAALEREFSQTRIPLRFPKHNQWHGQPQVEIRPTNQALIIRLADDGAEIIPMRWGLIPFFHKGKAVKEWKAATFNARAETVRTAASFKGPFARRRCLIVADGWYEWFGEGTPKPMYRIDPKAPPIMFAGIWERCETADAGEIESFTMVTQPAGAPLNTIHSRAPVTLYQDEWARWLDISADVTDLMDCENARDFTIERYHRPTKEAPALI